MLGFFFRFFVFLELPGVRALGYIYARLMGLGDCILRGAGIAN
jgi:hypothetical protein